MEKLPKNESYVPYVLQRHMRDRDYKALFYLVNRQTEHYSNIRIVRAFPTNDYCTAHRQITPFSQKDPELRADG